MKDIMLAYNNINNVFDVVKRAADRIGVKVLNEDINTYTIDLEGKGGIFSKSEPITINLEKIKDLQTKIYFDDHSKKGSLSSKNDTIEKLKLIIDELLPKVKMPEESNNSEMNSIQQDDYSKMDNYNNTYQEQQEMIQNQGVYQDSNMVNSNVSYQQLDQNPNYQEQQVMIPSQEMYQDQNMANYNYQPVDNGTIQVENSEQVSDPVNELMMGNYGNSEPSKLNNAPSQSSEKGNSDPLSDFMNNMSI